MKELAIFYCFIATVAQAQIRTVAVEELPVPRTEVWNGALFSPNGSELFLTNADYNGIWKFTINNHLLRQITGEGHSGFEFSLSPDGDAVVYRTTVVPGDHRTRVQESVELSLSNGTRTVLHSGNSIRTPKYIRQSPSAPEKLSSSPTGPAPSSERPVVLGIENGKILLLRGSVKTVVDPFGNGQYVWPQLSPDGTKIVAVEMDRGAFIADLDGNNIIRLGKCNAPQWTRDGRWIIGMDDKDDGHELISSEIVAVSKDGEQRVAMTNTPTVHEMYPAVSPFGNVIGVTSSDGKVFLLTFEEGK